MTGLLYYHGYDSSVVFTLLSSFLFSCFLLSLYFMLVKTSTPHTHIFIPRPQQFLRRIKRDGRHRRRKGMLARRRKRDASHLAQMPSSALIFPKFKSLHCVNIFDSLCLLACLSPQTQIQLQAPTQRDTTHLIPVSLHLVASRAGLFRYM